jgi:four helix bundle protein
MVIKKNSFENLLVWQKAVDLTIIIYQKTSSFPKEEIYGITSQIRRAAVSISSNIAEGSAKGSKRDFVRYILIALGSIAELKTQLIISSKLDYLDKSNFEEIYNKTEEVSYLLVKLKASLEKPTSSNVSNL